MFLLSSVHTESTETGQGDEELKMTIILFSEGVFIPSSDLFMDRNWVQKVGAGNLHAKGKEMLRQIGQFERQLVRRQGKSFSQRDVVMYAQDRNISIVGAYSFLQGLFSPGSGPANQKSPGQPTPTAQPLAPVSPAAEKGELGLTSVKAESGSGAVSEEPYDTTFLDVPIITNHNRFDPVLSTFGPSCPNIQMERERYADQSRYRDLTSRHAGFLTALNSKVFAESQVKIDSLKKASSLYEYLTAEQIINGSNELLLDPFELAQLRDIDSFVKYYAHFFQKKLVRSGSALLFQQITKDFREKIGEDFHTDSERESLLRSNKDKLVAGYSLSSAIIANFLVAFNLSDPDCLSYTADASATACLEWPSYGSSIRLQLIQQKSRGPPHTVEGFPRPAQKLHARVLQRLLRSRVAHRQESRGDLHGTGLLQHRDHQPRSHAAYHHLLHESQNQQPQSRERNDRDGGQKSRPSPGCRAQLTKISINYK